MNIKEIKELAQQRGLRPGRLKKDELIRAIQEAEDSAPCYMTNQVDYCGQSDCLWRQDCH